MCHRFDIEIEFTFPLHCSVGRGGSGKGHFSRPNFFSQFPFSLFRKQNDVEVFLSEYFKALEIHRKTLLTQISRAKEAKIVSIKDQQIDLSKRASDADAVIKFTDELLSSGSEIEILSFVGILLRRFEYCQNSKIPLDPKTSDTLKFLPEVRAPIAKSENNLIIPLYGIITTQVAVPKYCTLQSDDLMFLRIHRKAEIVMVSRDCYDKQLCHGGLTINVDLKYKDSTKHIPTDVSFRFHLFETFLLIHCRHVQGQR